MAFYLLVTALFADRQAPAQQPLGAAVRGGRAGAGRRAADGRDLPDTSSAPGWWPRSPTCHRAGSRWPSPGPGCRSGRRRPGRGHRADCWCSSTATGCTRPSAGHPGPDVHRHHALPGRAGRLSLEPRPPDRGGGAGWPSRPGCGTAWTCGPPPCTRPRTGSGSPRCWAAGLTFAIGMACRNKQVPAVLAWLGLVSFSVYLLHPLMIQLFRRLSITQGPHPFPESGPDGRGVPGRTAGPVLAVLPLRGVTYAAPGPPLRRLARHLVRPGHPPREPAAPSRPPLRPTKSSRPADSRPTSLPGPTNPSHPKKTSRPRKIFGLQNPPRHTSRLRLGSLRDCRGLAGGAHRASLRHVRPCRGAAAAPSAWPAVHRLPGVPGQHLPITHGRGRAPVRAGRGRSGRRRHRGQRGYG